MLGQLAAMEVTGVEVATTNNGGHPPEFWAKRAADKIMSVSDTAPPVIKDQALAFKAHIERVILHYMKEAVRSDRSTVAFHLGNQGEGQVADVIRRL